MSLAAVWPVARVAGRVHTMLNLDGRRTEGATRRPATDGSCQIRLSLPSAGVGGISREIVDLHGDSPIAGRGLRQFNEIVGAPWRRRRWRFLPAACGCGGDRGRAKQHLM